MALRQLGAEASGSAAPMHNAHHRLTGGAFSSCGLGSRDVMGTSLPTVERMVAGSLGCAGCPPECGPNIGNITSFASAEGGKGRYEWVELPYSIDFDSDQGQGCTMVFDWTHPPVMDVRASG